MSDDDWDAAVEERQTEADWQRHEALHDGENADPAGCWICREALADRQSMRSRQMHAARTPAERLAITAKAKASYPAERRGETSRRVHAEAKARRTVAV